MRWADALKFYQAHYDPEANVTYTSVDGLRQAMIRFRCVDRTETGNAKASEIRVREFIKATAHRKNKRGKKANAVSPLFNSPISKNSRAVDYSKEALAHVKSRYVDKRYKKPAKRKSGNKIYPTYQFIGMKKQFTTRRANVGDLLRPYGDWRS